MNLESLPQKGFYYHYKHNPLNGFENYAYEVIGIGHHTEIANDENSLFVIYRPLYESAFVYQNGKMFDARPLKMFMEEVEKEGKKIKRFTQITNSEIIERLQMKKSQMYES